MSLYGKTNNRSWKKIIYIVFTIFTLLILIKAVQYFISLPDNPILSENKDSVSRDPKITNKSEKKYNSDIYNEKTEVYDMYINFEKQFSSKVIDSDKILTIEVAALALSNSPIADLKSNDLKVHEAINFAIKNISKRELNDPNFKSNLAIVIKNSINKDLGLSGNSGEIKEIYFTHFLVIN